MFGPVITVRIVRGRVWMDFTNQTSLEKCIANKESWFRNEKLELLSTESFLNENFDLSVYVTDGGSEAQVRECLGKLGEIKTVKYYNNACSVVKFVSKSVRDNVLKVAESFSISSSLKAYMGSCIFLTTLFPPSPTFKLVPTPNYSEFCELFFSGFALFPGILILDNESCLNTQWTLVKYLDFSSFCPLFL